MANILLLDDSDIACQAMQGILARGHHRCIVARDGETAWKQLRELVKFDLLFIELKLKGENGLRFIERLRTDPFLKLLPVVVYTVVSQHEVVKKALTLKIQNYLIKPYRDEALYAEISKAVANPWRNLHFDEEKAFCAQMGGTPAELHKQREDLLAALKAGAQLFVECGESGNHKTAEVEVAQLIKRAEDCGAWGIVDLLNALSGEIEKTNWTALKNCKADLDYAAQLTFCQLNPVYVPEGFYSDQERKEKEEARERSFWFDTDVNKTGPLVLSSEVVKHLDELHACPVVNSAIAAFLMNSGGRAPGLQEMMDLVSKDPWLTAQVLIAANRLEREDTTPIEDPRTAVSLLGDDKLSSLAKTMPIVEERKLYFPPLSWAHLWAFQIGVARLSDYSCTYLEFGDIQPKAYTAGLLHDFGRLFLAKLFPLGFQAMVAFSKQHGVPLAEAEKKFIGWTASELGLHFAEKNGLPVVYREVIRHVDTPETAGEYAELSAIVALARHVCRHNHVGYSGALPNDCAQRFADTPAWAVLRQRVFPSFSLEKFEEQAHAFCAELKHELAGERAAS